MNYALIFAGGTGQRMDSKSKPKQFIKFNNKPLIVCTLERFQASSNIHQIVVIMLKKYIPLTQKYIKQYHLSKVKIVAPGGDTSQASIYNGLKIIHRLAKPNDIVLIHDGVRPFIDESLIFANIKVCKKYGSCITVTKNNETIVILDKHKVKNLVDRKVSYIGRAPQTFFVKDIYNAHLKAKKDKKEFIDSASLMRHYGHKLFVTPCSDFNIKLTTPFDACLLKAILDYQKKNNVKSK